MTQEDILNNPEKYDLSIETVGKGTLKSPMKGVPFVSESDRVSLTADIGRIQKFCECGKAIPSLEAAGPRETIFHDPAWTRAGIVTCGGLCPGLNNVIKGLVQVLWFDYGVRNIFGIPYGYRGLNPAYGYSPMILNPDVVDAIQEDGGTILGSSRGNQDAKVMVDTLMRLNINVLFCIGGDGTLRGAHDIAEEIKKRHQPISVIGIPKTIDNDLNLIDRTFGFETAVLSATDVITSAHNEANGAFNGLGLVKLMGRDSGFIAAYAALATTVVNICLVPEVPFTLDGLFKALESRYSSGKTHAVIVVAEGAGQELFKDQPERKDASGNILKNDIGEFLTRKIKEHFDKVGKEINIKYFDPSYMVRSIPAQGTDAIFCFQLAEAAVHAGMAGKTDMVVGSMNNAFSHVPIEYAVSERKKINPNGVLWHAVLGITRQQDYFSGKGKGK
ncbi:diphosphate--fructose-6-phosphate 1-phosphotransferase [Fibrobacter sp. UWB1]|uniref:ATP-dependent 6-phosphofructokinase n=1 Tax=unclassified Fibrobacter TaxID=2634177 RepID=UPI000916460D|nr:MULTISPECIES: ATP-dependent 6-phosphofructokinase [unclassified Fibrobacter]OWV24119.1 diphosphate--fructose-6-phosphate 1-phosphotransferase [Fibrobacter sp. UWB1]SHL76413.1 6-phosphofructokinase [Fibrobacter sp. UWOV1]